MVFKRVEFLSMNSDVILSSMIFSEMPNGITVDETDKLIISMLKDACTLNNARHGIKGVIVKFNTISL